MTTDLADPGLASLSPALRVPSGPSFPAFEIKFLVSDETAAQVEQQLLRALAPDPHADPALGGMYAISSLACDSPDFAVFFRDPKTRNRKYRLRRYGASDAVYLERKRSKDGKVRKRRVEAARADLASIAEGESSLPSHAWFLRELQVLDAAPVCLLRYHRRALFGVGSEGPMRVTFDRNIRGTLAAGWSFDPQGDERTLLQGLVVCEFKFQAAMPSQMKNVVAALGLEPTGVSKYRTCVRAFAQELGVTLPAANDHDAKVELADRGAARA